MTDLRTVYEQIAHPWAHRELAEHYREAKRRGEPPPECEQVVTRPVAMVATAVPPCATLSVAIHVIHMLPATADPGLVDHLLDNAERGAALTINPCHQALELDGRANDYTADEWLTTVYDIASALLETARHDTEPPSLVQQAQDAVSWLSRAIIELDQDNRDATAAIADSLGHTLALYVFANVARHAPRERGPLANPAPHRL